MTHQEESNLIQSICERLDGLSDSTINKMYAKQFVSRGFSPDEKRFALTANLAYIADKVRKDRSALGLTLSQMAHMLGYEGEHTRQMMHSIETGKKALMPAQARLMMAYLEGYRPKDWPD